MSSSYYFILSGLFIFGCMFFTSEFYITKIKQLQSKRLLFQSKVYLDSSIDNASGLLENGVKKGRIAMLLDPYNEEAQDNYVSLLFRTDPVKAVIQKSNSDLLKNNHLEQDKLLRKCLNLLSNENLNKEEIKIVASIAISLSDGLESRKLWASNPENRLLQGISNYHEKFNTAPNILKNYFWANNFYFIGIF